MTGDWLAQRLKDPNVVIVDMSGDDFQYQRFHLPGAVRLPYSALVQRRRDGVVLRLDDARLYKVLGQVGIGAQTHVVAYDDMGGLHAGRLFWELERIGHERVSVLDGGLVQWILDGRAVVAEPAASKPTRYVSSSDRKRRDNEIAIDEVRASASEKNAVLLDVRSLEEYAGNLRDPRSGHIPGGIWWPWEQAVRFDDGFSLQSPETLGESLAAAGITKRTEPVILYCRTGHRASQTYWALRNLGFENVRLYDGSMAEYGLYKQAGLVRGKSPCAGPC